MSRSWNSCRRRSLDGSGAARRVTGIQHFSEQPRYLFEIIRRVLNQPLRERKSVRNLLICNARLGEVAE